MEDKTRVQFLYIFFCFEKRTQFLQKKKKTHNIVTSNTFQDLKQKIRKINLINDNKIRKLGIK